MKIKFLLDENLSPRLKVAVLRLNPEIDILRIGEPNTPPLGTLDPECLTQVSETLEIAWKEKKVAGYGMLRLTEHQRTSHVNHYQSLCSTTFFTVSTQPMARPATPQGISLDGHSSNL